MKGIIINNIIAIMYGIFAMFYFWLPIQWFTMILFDFFRVTFFSYIYAILHANYGNYVFGTAVGLVNFMGGIAGLSQYPLVLITERYLNSNYQIINIVMVVIKLPLFFVPWYIYQKHNKQKKTMKT